jgi:hypothetical protein
MIRQFLDKRIPNVKTSLVDFISVEEMKDIFFHTESRLDLVGEIDSRLRGYFSSLPETLLAELGEGILPLYYIKNIVFFPFSEFFALFHHDIGDGEPVEKPVFQPAEIYPTLDYLEKFYCALYPLRRRTIDTLVYPEVLDFFARMKNGGTFQELGLEDRDSIMSFVEKQMRNIHLVSLRVLKSVPLPALIRYYKEDPYYKLMIYLPKPHLKDFYTNSTRLKVFTDFEDFFAKVRFDIVEDMVHTLFGKEDLVEFEFYMNSNLNLTPKAGLPGFTHHRSLVILSNILRVQYRGFIQEIIHILTRVMTNRLRDSSNIILLHAAGIEELASRIKNFDVSFSPDSEDGKTLIRLKYVVDRDPHQQKVYRNLIATKDKEAKELLEKGVGHLEGLLLGFMGIAKDLVFLKESSKRMPGLEAKVSRAVETLVLAGKAVRYFIALERGSL